MSFRTLSALLRGTWLIDRGFAEQQMPLLVSMLQGKLGAGTPITGAGETERPFALNNGVRYDVTVFDWRSGTYIANPNLPDNSVGVIPIIGGVTKYDGDCGVPGTISKMAWLADFQNNPKILGTINFLDCPGGQADGTPQFSEAISEAPKPKISLINGGAYSAGYWFACGAPEIYFGHESDGAGSIGAYTTIMDFAGYFEQQGIKIHEIYPPESADKNLAYRNALKGDYTLASQGVSGLALGFRSAVADSRGDRLKSDDWNTGKVFNGQQAVDLGLVDGIIGINDAEYRIRELSKDSARSLVSFSQSTKSQENNMRNPFVDNFSALTVMSGKKADEITPEMVAAANAQIVAQNIPGVSLTLDSVIDQLSEGTGKVTELEGKITQQDATIKEHVATIASLNKKLDAPAVDASAPPVDGNVESISNTETASTFEKTSADLEAERIIAERKNQ